MNPSEDVAQTRPRTVGRQRLAVNVGGVLPHQEYTWQLANAGRCYHIGEERDGPFPLVGNLGQSTQIPMSHATGTEA